MWDSLFIWKKVVQENPIHDLQYQQLLWLNPALAGEIQRHVRDVLFEDIRELKKDELYDNNDIVSEAKIQKAKLELISELEKLSELTDNPQHIVVIVDGCFTNHRLLILLKKILGKEHFSKFVKVVPIDYDAKADNAYLEEQLSINHSLFILGGSLSDTYNMNGSHYTSALSQSIQEVADEYAPRYLNKRFIGICFWQQYLANVIGIANKNSSGIIATLKGPSQFAPSNCTIQELEYINPIFGDVLAGLSNQWNNSHFSSAFTRNGYVSFDLLKSEWNLGVVPLIKDEATGGIVGWGSKNGNILWVQFHPEISFLEHTFHTKKHLRKIVPALSVSEEDQEKILSNYDIWNRIKRDIGEAFYTFSLLSYIKDINLSYQQISAMFSESVPAETVSYGEAMTRLVKTNSDRVNFIMEQNNHLDSDEMVAKWIDAIDKKWRLLLNYQLDWKVSRSIGEISEILGIRSIVDLIKDHQEMQGSGNYVVRDLGAGDGNTLKELYNNLKNRDIIFYGTGDYIYFDLFTTINSTRYKEQMHEELIILFVEKVVGEFKKLHGASTIQKIKQAIANISFSKNDTIQNSSMTNKKTLMFEGEHESALSQEIQDNFEQHMGELEELKTYITENIYTLFSGFFQKIYISKFNDIRIQEPIISHIDFQYSIRATSHVNGREYMKIISEYFYNSAKPGSIFIDNGIHQSYTSIPRLKELYDVSFDIVGGNFKLVYDTQKNYFSSVIITKEKEYSDEFWEAHLDANHILVPLKEAYRSTFFQLEYFIRNFITSNFKNSIVFWNFNDQIIDTLKIIMQELKNKNTENIPGIILDLINHIAKNYHDKWVQYDCIDITVLDKYLLDGESLKTILKRDIFIPIWMNIHANRDY